MSLRSPSVWITVAVLACAAVAVVGCGSEDRGVEPRPALVRFEPPPGDLTVVAFVPVVFRALDEAGDEVTARFTLDGELVGVDTKLQWRGEVLGDNVLVAEAEHGGRTFRAQWQIHVTDEGAQDPPPVVVFAAREGDTPGSIAASWDRPSRSLHPTPILEYELAYATSPIVDDATFESLPRIVVPNNEDAITQHQVVENLIERDRYYLRLRVRDHLQRESVLSLEISSEATGHFDISGIVYEIDRTPQPPRPLNRVLVDLEGVKAFTNASGVFGLLNVPDLRSRRLSVIEDQQFFFYSILSSPLSPVTRQFEFYLFPREFIRISGSEETFIPLLEFLRAMTGNAGSSQTEFERWEEYPVRVYAHEHVYHSTTGETVDYRQAMVTAVERWNTQAGTELLRIVDSMPEVGSYYTTDILEGEGRHGQVVLERPAGQIFQVVPELMRVRLRDNFGSQAVADRIIAHELGHVLLLGHSQSVDHLMNVAAPSVTGGVPHRDEAYTARLLASLPIGMDSRWYTEPAPAR